MFIAGSSLRFVAPLAVSGIVGTLYLGFHMKERLGRMLAFMDLEKYKETYGLQQWQALIAFGSGGVHGLGADAGPDRGAGSLLGVLQHLVIRGKVRWRRTDHVGARAVRAVTARHGSADVDHDGIAGGEHPAGCSVVRAGGVGPGCDDREVRARMPLGHDRVGDIGGHLQLGPPRPQPAGQPGA